MYLPHAWNSKPLFLWAASYTLFSFSSVQHSNWPSNTPHSNSCSCLYLRHTVLQSWVRCFFFFKVSKQLRGESLGSEINFPITFQTSAANFPETCRNSLLLWVLHYNVPSWWPIMMMMEVEGCPGDLFEVGRREVAAPRRQSFFLSLHFWLCQNGLEDLKLWDLFWQRKTSSL